MPSSRAMLWPAQRSSLAVRHVHESSPLGHAARDSQAEALSACPWEVLVIGTGMGGAMLGRRLAEAGHRVLMLEKGHANFERASGALPYDDLDPERRLENGLWPRVLTGTVDGRSVELNATVGCGAGGSTLLYAAALERLERRDLESSDSGPRWPIDYEELAPYYEEAERLFGVRGTRDPLCSEPFASPSAPASLSECDQSFQKVLERNGRSPYQLHVAFGDRPGCEQCAGRICLEQCKRDARTVGVWPALRHSNARLLDRCEVLRLESDGDRIKEVVALREGRELRLRARFVVMAAGAYHSPVLLLRSKGPGGPGTLANRSDQVGRNLMFHVSDFIAVWPKRRGATAEAQKSLAFRDHYQHEGRPLGAVQSTGMSADYGNVLFHLRKQFDESPLRSLRPLRAALRVPAKIATRVFGKATIFATIQADLPYGENRVLLDPDAAGGMRFEYTVRPELRRRVELFRRLVKQAFAPLWSFFLGGNVNLNHGHPCGTLRFGTDPRTSVLDRNCRAHDVENLYVVDGSFMPSSGGTNPSLTIAANSLRVAERIDARLRSELPSRVRTAR